METESAGPPAKPARDLSGLSIPDRDRSGGGAGRWIKRIGVLAALGMLGFLFKDRILGAVSGARAVEVESIVLAQVAAEDLLVLDGTAANGYVFASRRAALSADAPGRIVELNVTEGSEIEEGEVVARLYFEEAAAELEQARAQVGTAEREVERARAQLTAAEADVPRLERAVDGASAAVQARTAAISAAEARLELARLQLERVQPLVQSQVRPQTDLDQARATLDAAQADLEAARADHLAAEARLLESRGAVDAWLGQVEVTRTGIPFAEAQVVVAQAALAGSEARYEKTFVRAPFSGIVVLKDAEIGEVVSPNSQGGSNARGSVATMVDRASLEVQAEVPETSLAAVRVGGLARVFLDAYPEAPYEARVDRIWPTANRQKATVEVRVAFEQPDAQLRPEMGVRVVFLDPELDAAGLEEARQRGDVLLVPDSAVVERDDARGVFVVREGLAEFLTCTFGEQRAGQTLVESGVAAGERVVLDPPEALESGAAVRAGDA